MYSRIAILCAAAALLAVSALPAADDKPEPEKPKAGLVKGADLPGAFHPFNVANGKYENKFHSLTNEHGLNPGVLVFVQNVTPSDKNTPVFALLAKLDKYITEKPKTRLKASAVFLFNDMPDVVKDDDVRQVHSDELLKLKNDEERPLGQVVLCLDSIAHLQKAGYDVRPEDQVVVVLYDQLRVKNVYHSVDGKIDVDAIEKEVTKELAPFKK